MNSQNIHQKSKYANIGKKNNKEEKNGFKTKNSNNNNQKKIIESYNTKNNAFQCNKTKINLESNVTFDKKNNLSLFSILSNTNQDDILINKSLKTIKETKDNQLNLKYSNINRKKKIFLNSNTISTFRNPYIGKLKPKKTNENFNNIMLCQELDNFQNRIDGLLKVIEDFEAKYIYSDENKRIKDELNKIVNNKKYFNKNLGYSPRKIIIKSRQKKKDFREAKKNIFNKEINNNNKTMILRNYKFNIINNNFTQNNYYSTKNININNNNSAILNKNDISKNIIYINSNNNNAYKRMLYYSTLLDVKTSINDKAKNIKDNKKNKIIMNKEKTEKIKPKPHHLPSKSNDFQTFEFIRNNKDKNNKEDNMTKKIYWNPSYSKTPKIFRAKRRIKKFEKKKSNNINNANKKKKNIKK